VYQQHALDGLVVAFGDSADVAEHCSELLNEQWRVLDWLERVSAGSTATCALRWHLCRMLQPLAPDPNAPQPDSAQVAYATALAAEVCWPWPAHPPASSRASMCADSYLLLDQTCVPVSVHVQQSFLLVSHVRCVHTC
jgi:hypothetical protein